MSGTDDVRAESTIGERIRRLRSDVLMTQDDVAAAAGVSTDLVPKLEQGRRHTASIGSLHRIATALDVDLGQLLGRDSMPDAAPDAGVVALRRDRRRRRSARSTCGVRIGATSGTSSPS